MSHTPCLRSLSADGGAARSARVPAVLIAVALATAITLGFGLAAGAGHPARAQGQAPECTTTRDKRAEPSRIKLGERVTVTLEVGGNCPPREQKVDVVLVIDRSSSMGSGPTSALQAAKDAGLTVVTWDSPIPSAEGEDVFVAQVDFDETGKVMADMAMNIIGEAGGQFAVLSASPDAANQNAWIAALQEVLEADDTYAALELVDIVYGNDQSEDSYDQALALVDKYPDLKLIMAPTTVGIAAAAKAMQDEDLCDTVKVSGLGLPAEMVSYTLNDCAPEFALWSFVDLGYLTYYTTYLLATGQMEAAEGITFEAGRMGTYTIEKDPTRDAGLRVLMGPFTVYNAENVEAAAQ